MQPELRTIRFEPTYEESLKRIDPDPVRGDQMTQAAIDRIAKDPTNCPIVGNGPFRISQAHAYPGGPILQVWFLIVGPDSECAAVWVRSVPDPVVSYADLFDDED